MGKKDPRIDAYIARSAEFAKPILQHLRTTIHDACPDVEETMKWQFPHFEYQGTLCSMASFKQHCAFGFWKPGLVLGDPKGRGAGEDAMGQFGRITSVKDLPSVRQLTAWVKKAAALNAQGVKDPTRTPRRTTAPVQVPPIVDAALKKSARARKAFDGFSPSHQREYVDWITEAKAEPTRRKRVATMIEWLCEGKSRNWKYGRSK